MASTRIPFQRICHGNIRFNSLSTKFSVELCIWGIITMFPDTANTCSGCPGEFEEEQGSS
jgi:hypothetical protein